MPYIDLSLKNDKNTALSDIGDKRFTRSTKGLISRTIEAPKNKFSNLNNS